MTINFSTPHDQIEMRPRITVVGVGGAGGNAVNNMIRANLEGVDFIATNTDSQALSQSLADRRLQLGNTVTQGLGAGSRPDVGCAAAEEAIDDLIKELGDSNMVFITAGMGGGTGTGAAPVIAQAARERGILTVGVVTKPFHFEGAHRMRIADRGIEELTQYVDTLIIIPNQNLFRIANEKTTFADAFHMADNVLHQGVRGVTDLIVMPGLINLDFADIRTVMSEMGKAMMGTGEASGERRAVDAAESAIKNPLLDDMSMQGARGVLINITGGMDMTLFEVDEAANRIREEVDHDANIIFGSTFDEKLDGMMRVSVVATGISAEGIEAKPRPQMTLVSNTSDENLNTDNKSHSETEKKALPNLLEQPDLKNEFELEKESMPKTGTDDVNLVGPLDNQEKMTSPLDKATEFAKGASEVPNQSLLVNTDSVGVEKPKSVPPKINAMINNTFIAAPPVLPNKQGKVQNAENAVDPFNAAAVVNTKSEVGRSKGPNLFQRVTGMGRKIKMDTQRVETEHPNLLLGTSLSSNQSVISSASSSSDTRESGDKTSEKSTSRNPEDDLLDIPAFLRRQVN